MSKTWHYFVPYYQNYTNDWKQSHRECQRVDMADTADATNNPGPVAAGTVTNKYQEKRTTNHKEQDTFRAVLILRAVPDKPLEQEESDSDAPAAQ